MPAEKVEVQVDVDTKGAAKNIDLLNKKVETSIGDFDNLNEAISKTQDTLGKIDPKSAQFKELSKELAGLKDRLKDTEIQSVRFTEALAKQPGVVGLVGQSLEGLRGTMKVFMANPIIAVLAGISAAFLALRESLTRTEEGQAKLTKITEGLEKIMNGLFAVIEPIAMKLADMVVGLLENEKVMKTLSTVAGVLGAAFGLLFNNLSAVGTYIVDVLIGNFKALVAVAQGAGNVIKGVFTFDWDLIKEGSKKVFDGYKDGVNNIVNSTKTLATTVVDGVVTAYKDGVDAFGEGTKRLTKKGKEEKDKFDAEAEKDRQQKENDRKAREAQRLADIEAANKIQLEAELSLLEDRDRQLKERELRYQEELAALKKAGFTDLKAFEEEYRKDVLEINTNFDEQESQRQKDADEKLKADKAKTDEEAKRKAEELANFIISVKQYEQESLQFIQDAQLANIQGFGSLLGQIAGKNKKLAIAGLLIEKGGAIGQVLVDTARSISAATANAFASPLNLVPGGSLKVALNLAREISQIKITGGIATAGIIAGAAQGISQINKAQIPGGDGGGGSVGGGGASAPSYSAPSAVGVPQIQSNVGQTTGTQIAQTLNKSQQPLKAYVVQQDISTNGALYRRTNSAATFGG
jgi:hypothetical protein